MLKIIFSNGFSGSIIGLFKNNNNNNFFRTFNDDWGLKKTKQLKM